MVRRKKVSQVSQFCLVSTIFSACQAKRSVYSCSPPALPPPTTIAPTLCKQLNRSKRNLHIHTYLCNNADVLQIPTVKIIATTVKHRVSQGKGRGRTKGKEGCGGSLGPTLITMEIWTIEDG